MKVLLYHKIYTIIFYRCGNFIFNFFRKNINTGFIVERAVDIEQLKSILPISRFFLIINIDDTPAKEIYVIKSLVSERNLKYLLFFHKTNLNDFHGNKYKLNENDGLNAIKYIETLREKEIYENDYLNLYESIEYASKIQKAILPDLSQLNHFFSDFFIYNNPRDVVSGDFYWFATINDMIFLAVGDCTGHGVPGAFMSILGITMLNETVFLNGRYETDAILNNLRDKIISSLRQSFKNSDVHDGMDIAIFAFRPEYDILQYSGAFNPIVIIRDDRLIELKTDRMPVGIFIKEDLQFSKKYFDLKKNDQIYLFSDGYSDQTGGINSKKLRKNRFYELLFENRKFNMEEQKENLIKFMEKWRGSNEQIDDMLIIGLKI